MDQETNPIPPTNPLSPRETRVAQLCHLAIAPKLLVQSGISILAAMLVIETLTLSPSELTGYESLAYLFVALLWPLAILLAEILLGSVLTLGIRAVLWPSTEAEPPFIDHYRRTTRRFQNRVAQGMILSVAIFFLFFVGWCGMSSNVNASAYLEPTLIGLIAIALICFGFGVVFQVSVMIQGIRHASRGDRYQPPWTT